MQNLLCCYFSCRHIQTDTYMHIKFCDDAASSYKPTIATIHTSKFY